MIVGTPTIITAPARSIVTGSNASGSANVSVSPAPPFNLIYSPSALVCPVHASCALPAPTSSGGPVDSYFISAPLPDGMDFHQTQANSLVPSEMPGATFVPAATTPACSAAAAPGARVRTSSASSEITTCRATA